MKPFPLALTLAAASLGCLDAGAPPGPTPGSPEFDGERAFAKVERQVMFGPRIPGTAGHIAQLEWMTQELASLAPDLVADTFSYITTYDDSLTLVNLTARFLPEMERRILILTHWDTRPQSDQGATQAERDIPPPGANDGASGTAVLLELARLLAENPPPLGVDLLFVDGEDYGPDAVDMFIGARHYAELLVGGDLPGARPMYGVLLDMVGDSDPSFLVEPYSQEAASVVVSKVWRAAARLGHADVFPESLGVRLNDDHVPLIQAGLPTANVIDFTYGGPTNPFWHTPNDSPANVSARTLGIVGQVVTELIYSGG